MHIRSGIGFLVLVLCSIGCNTAPKPDGKIPITTASEEARAAFLKGRDLADNLRTREAGPLLEEAIGKDPNFAMAHLISATIANSTDNFYSHLNAAVASAGKASDGERLLIEGFEAGANGNPLKRGESYAKLVELFPADERAHQLLGIHLNGIQDFEGAVAQYQKATELAPNFAPAYNQLGYALRAVGEDAEAEAAFRKYIELIPNEPNPYDSLAELLMKNGRFDESIAQYQKALELNPKFITGHRGIAANLMYQGKHAEALAELEKMQGIAMNDGERRDALMDMAIVLVDEGKPDAAIEKISGAVALAEKAGDRWEMAQAVRAKADVLLHQGKPADAKAAYEAAHAQVADSGVPEQLKAQTGLMNHGNLALVAAAGKDFATADKEAETMRAGIAETGNPNQMRRVNEVLGMVALQQTKWDDAIAAFEKANQQSPFVIYQLGKAYAGKGDAQAAREHYAKAAKANVLPTIYYAMIRSDAIAAAK